MNISEERLRELIQRILMELEAEKPAEKKKKIYMVCGSEWDDRYLSYLSSMEQETDYQVCPVIPESWNKLGYEARLLNYRSCVGIWYRSCKRPEDLLEAITVFPVVSRDTVVKTALCIGDTFETSWIFSCMEAGGRIVFMRTGLKKYSGKEPKAYMEQILAYYRKIISYGIEIQENKTTDKMAKTEEKKRVITASNIDRYAQNGVLVLRTGDIVTDLARDRARELAIEIT